MSLWSQAVFTKSTNQYIEGDHCWSNIQSHHFGEQSTSLVPLPRMAKASYQGVVSDNGWRNPFAGHFG
ncbi:hypothetical protein Tsubulata_012271 [Turnera subulata]|uniref:Uncharacterized protein n=1 Tax=Turnera subulata TaxID=218843 RepID=A0A9Q0FT77_9ROSI|nr:hypothetical protein Tsubulata_012271 [Turnera subulata]